MHSGRLEFPEIAVVYAWFAALTSLSSDLGGSLLLYSALDGDGIAVAIASNVAGAASLGLDPDTARAKLALKSGVCDFLVNNLDEALRVLKNEIRKRRPVSVVLTSDADATVAEIVARGVQPELVTFSVGELIERGARLLNADAENELIPITWGVASEPVRWLPAVDALAAASIEAFASDIDARSRWIAGSPRYLGRVFEGRRFLRMTDAEADAFVAAIRVAVKTGAVPVEVSAARGDETILIVP